jgi:cystinosin
MQVCLNLIRVELEFTYQANHINHNVCTTTMASFLEILSQIFGWVYTISWSLSFYPQPLLNFRRKSTSGTTIDFPLINVLGFLAYFTSNVAFLYSPVIREQYALRNHGLTPTVEFNDLAFAGHAVILSILTYTQFFPWIWGFDKKGRKGTGATVSKGIMGILIGCITGVVITALVVGSSPRDDVRTGWAWIDVVSPLHYLAIN